MIAVAFPLFSAIAVTSTATPEHVLPMWMQDAHPAVAVTLESRNEPLRFVVDSAAGASLVDSRIVRRYGLENPDDKLVGDIRGASSSAAVAHRMRMADWNAGTMKLKVVGMHTELAALSKTEEAVVVDGILGNDITRRWDARWDFAGNQLQLWPADALPDGPHCQANALPERKPGLTGFGFINARLGETGVKAIAVVDTGAAQTVLNLAAAQALGLRTDGSDPRVQPRKTGTQGLGGQPQASWLYTLPELSSAGWQHPPLEIRISALPVFRSLGLEASPALILGADAMRNGQLDISAGARRICLSRQPDTDIRADNDAETDA